MPRLLHRRLRRPAALTAVAAVAAVLLSAPAALAHSSSLSVVSGTEAAGEQVTYQFSCQLDEGDTARGADWSLWTWTGEETGVSGGVTLTTNTPTQRAGTFTVDYADVDPGLYNLHLRCPFREDGYFPANRTVELDGPVEQDVATTTTLTASRTTGVVTGDQVTFTATVPGAPAGDVVFTIGGTENVPVPLSGGTATLTRTITGPTSVVAAYTGTTGYAASASGYVGVDPITAITPGVVGLTSTPTVGAPVTVGTHGWAPSEADGLTLTYAWKDADGTVLGTGPTYTPTAADLGKAIHAEVTGTRAPLAPRTVSTNAPVVLPGTMSGAVAITGTTNGVATAGTTLTSVPSGWPAGASFAHQWYVDGELRSEQATFTPGTRDLGQEIWLEVRVTAAGYGQEYGTAWASVAKATPTVTVGSSTIVAGRDATVPVTVAGPKGGPVPAGDVQVTLTPQGGGAPVVLDEVALGTQGTASVVVPGLSLGRWTATATYAPEDNRHTFARASSGSAGPYRSATGTGTVTVIKVPATVTAPERLDVPVATPGAFDVTVGGTPLPSTWLVRSGDTVLVRGDVPADGRVRVTLPVLAPGTHTLVLELPETSAAAAATRVITVTVAGEPGRVGALPGATLDTPKAATAPGQQMQLVAEGFEPGETVAFYLHSDPVFLGTAVAGADGVARLLADIPADVPSGAHTVIATGGTSGRWATLPVELAVPAATPAAADPELAVTGAQPGLVMAGAWLMLLTGGALVLVARRVRAQR
ncbi:Ig-like domain-containing protein [Cellulomonas sp. GbtcB1]|uniref:Ig-like domain-containing protein n=1 Tax=Cellulomonas sp. GbtcB1 TaxID=2824746 RepID=UPI001C2F2F38|nr:Ig-like domain-containing protein [Cellulomonas sp. GbtcB1]